MNTKEKIIKAQINAVGRYLVTIQTSKKGKLVRKVMVKQYVYLLGESIYKEYYISMLIDRSKGKTIIIYSPKGGINIEK